MWDDILKGAALVILVEFIQVQTNTTNLFKLLGGGGGLF